MATPQERQARFGYSASDQVQVLPSDDASALDAAGAPAIQGDAGDEPSDIHESALVLSEVLKSAIEMAEDLERQGQSADVDDTAKRSLGQVAKLLGQASAVLATAETALGMAGAGEGAAPKPPLDAVRRALASRRPPPAGG